jgi:hypothetical protein
MRKNEIADLCAVQASRVEGITNVMQTLEVLQVTNGRENVANLRNTVGSNIYQYFESQPTQTSRIILLDGD